MMTVIEMAVSNLGSRDNGGSEGWGCQQLKHQYKAKEVIPLLSVESVETQQ